jgi:hypothetical protein
MTARHVKRPHGWVDRACTRLAGWYDDLRYGRRYEEELPEPELTDDNGEPISDLVTGVGQHDGEDRTHVHARQGPPLHSPTGGGVVYPSLAPEDVPGPRAQAAEGSGSNVDAGHGPGYFHDDAPAEFIPTERIGGAYIPNLGYQDDDTLIQPRPEPRGGRSIWAPPQRPRTWVDDLVQRVMQAPIAEVRRALETPDPDMYLWNMSQRRALAAA